MDGRLLAGWIPCSERLPEMKGKYLTVRTEYDNCKDKVIKIQEISRFDPADRYDVEFFRMEVDAWQPLPELWEGEQE